MRMFLKPPKVGYEAYMIGHKVEEMIEGVLLALLPKSYRLEKMDVRFDPYDFVIVDADGLKYNVEVKSCWGAEVSDALYYARKKNPDIIIIYNGREGKTLIYVDGEMQLLSKRTLMKAIRRARECRISRMKR